jgi:hypothetical protein
MHDAPDRMRRRRVILGLAAAGALGCLALLFWFDPARSWFYPRCLFHTVTGLYCPGCGSLRALHALVHGHPWRAFRLNPLLFVAALAGACLALRRSPPSRRWRVLAHPAAAWGIPLVIGCYWLARNLPYGPFALLAPR